MRLIYKLLLAAPVLFLLYFYGLTRVGMLGPDEPRYAAIGREMARSGDWITPKLWGEPWFEKPPLLYWLIAAGRSAGLGDDLGPRLPVAAVSAAFLVFFFFRIRREFGEQAAWYATAVLGTSVGWLAYSRVAVTDVPLAAAFSASMLLALPWIRSGGRRGLVASGVLLGFAVLAKGLVPLVLALPLIWVGRKRWPDLVAMGVAAGLVAIPWYLACYIRNGDPFIDVFFWKHHFSRFVSPALQHVQPWWFYIPVFLGLLFPWTPAVAALRGLEWREPRRMFLLGWFLFGFVFFSASTNKLPGYILPLLPPMAALVGVQLARGSGRFMLGPSALLLIVTPFAAGLLPEAVAAGLSRASLDAVNWPAVAALAIAAPLVFLLEQRNRDAAVAAVAGLMVVCVAGLVIGTFPELDRVASARPWWREVEREGRLPCVEDVHRNLRYGLHYYAGRELPACSAERHRIHDILDRN